MGSEPKHQTGKEREEWQKVLLSKVTADFSEGEKDETIKKEKARKNEN